MGITARGGWTGALFALVVAAPIVGCASFLDVDWTPAADGAGGAGGGSSLLVTSGTVAECAVDADCPGGGECRAASCAEGACALVDAPVESACADGVCDGHGTCVACVADADCGGGRCVAHACETCSDGAKNGAETDVDCGGADCAPCENGERCEEDGDCATARCDDGRCKKPHH